MKIFDVIIVGAGAAGLMCAIEAGKRGRKVLILDKAEKVGKKILISGGGRCNFTNLYTSAENFISSNPHFCKSALSRYSQWDFIALMESHGLSWQEKTLGQLFCDQKSTAVVEMLTKECAAANVSILLNQEITTIEKTENFEVQTQNDNYSARSLVIASGGPSIPRMGSTDFALQVAKQFSIKNIPFSPALVPFTFSPDFLEDFIKDLSGISHFVELCTQPENHNTSAKSRAKQTCFKEAILFTHRGISGPAALQVSSYWNKNEKIRINLFPDQNIHDWLKQQQTEHPAAELKTILSYKLPKRLAIKLQETFFLNLPKSMQKISAQQLEKITWQLENWELAPSGTEGMRTAEVSLGGIDCDQLSSKTFESKSVDGLYFIGECIDVTGHLGGFNFQWAWASGWCAGQTI